MGNGPSAWTRRVIGTSASGRDSQGSPSPAAGAQPLTTFFDEGCQIDGRLAVRTSIEIDGEFRGRIESQETVTVGVEAAVDGSIRARSVRVEGAVVGDIEGSREVVITGTGRVHGDVSTPSFVLERGAFFNGQARMYRPEVAARLSSDGSESPPTGPPMTPASPD